jgi:transcriptional regulator with XRE-family HTH domain
LGYESATAISLIESGERRVKIEDLEKLAEVLKRSLEYFLGKEGKEIDITVALRAAKDIPDGDKKVIERIIELAKQRHGNRNTK